MARRGFKKARRYAARAFKRYRKSSAKGLTPMEMGIGSFGYGLVRNPISGLVPNVAMLGDYSDNVILGGLGGLAAMKGSGIVKKAGLVILGNELYHAGTRAASGFTSGNGGTSLNNINY
jgi:hypothetical protein